MQVRNVATPDGISWHVEQYGLTEYAATPNAKHEHIVLVPSGEGDCENLVKVAKLLAQQVPSSVVTTFDMPGFSRSTVPHGFDYSKIGDQITTLLGKLGIHYATFFGNSSGAGSVLAVNALHPAYIKCAVIHECPLAKPEAFKSMIEQNDEDMLKTFQHLFANVFIEQDANDGPAKWAALGPEYHARLEKNLVTWGHHYVYKLEDNFGEYSQPQYIRDKPIFWTVGTLSDASWWTTNFEAAEKAGLPPPRTDVLNSKHFPYVTVPEDTAKWIAQCVAEINTKQHA